MGWSSPKAIVAKPAQIRTAPSCCWLLCDVISAPGVIGRSNSIQPCPCTFLHSQITPITYIFFPQIVGYRSLVLEQLSVWSICPGYWSHRLWEGSRAANCFHLLCLFPVQLVRYLCKTSVADPSLANAFQSIPAVSVFCFQAVLTCSNRVKLSIINGLKP